MTNANNSPEIAVIRKLTSTITLENASPNFNLDDENLTKSCGMAELKQRLTRIVNCDFDFLTQNVLNQKDSNLCVPISVTVLLRWAIKNDLKVDDNEMEFFFTVEKILTKLTMMIYPRSLAGMNLNPRNKEKQFQHNKIELLLRRIKNETYIKKSGWDMIQGSKFSRKVECESEAKAKFFSEKNAKRKRSEFACLQCEKMRSEPFSKNCEKNAKIL